MIYRRLLDMYGSQIEYIRPNLSLKPLEYHTEKIMLHKIGFVIVIHRMLEYKQKRDKVQIPHSVGETGASWSENCIFLYAEFNIPLHVLFLHRVTSVIIFVT